MFTELLLSSEHNLSNKQFDVNKIQIQWTKKRAKGKIKLNTIFIAVEFSRVTLYKGKIYVYLQMIDQ